MKTHLLIILLLAMATQAPADVTGNEMLRYCNTLVKQAEGKEVTPEESVGVLYAIGYLAGFTDSHAVEMAFSEPKKTLYCLPPTGVENEQLARIIQKHLKQFPEKLHQNARVEILIALAKAFPCKEK